MLCERWEADGVILAILLRVISNRRVPNERRREASVEIDVGRQRQIHAIDTHCVM